MRAVAEVVEDLTRRDFLDVAGRCRLPVLFVNGLGDPLFRASLRWLPGAAGTPTSRSRPGEWTCTRSSTAHEGPGSPAHRL
ncbi:hypothetical protein ACIPW5_36480 [Streptomyces sp. NPDC090077]|uniref:hypothetical protein n=1 Tax=Streptomyces sp. NPDC090077 TaxID=3365938 RepID=UPI00381112FA